MNTSTHGADWEDAALFGPHTSTRKSAAMIAVLSFHAGFLLGALLVWLIL